MTKAARSGILGQVLREGLSSQGGLVMENLEYCCEEDPEVEFAPPPPTDENEAKKYLLKFFQNKTASFGGPVPVSDLLSERNLTLLCKLELRDCIDIFHLCLEENGWEDEQARVDEFYKIQHESKVLEIPKHYSGGILLVWLDICCGYSLS